jgi:hypothetical protein
MVRELLLVDPDTGQWSGARSGKPRLFVGVSAGCGDHAVCIGVSALTRWIRGPVLFPGKIVNLA